MNADEKERIAREAKLREAKLREAMLREVKLREVKLREITEFRLQNPLFDKIIWTISETADFLDLSVGTIYNLTSKKKIPFEKKRKRLYFKPRDILNWIKEGN